MAHSVAQEAARRTGKIARIERRGAPRVHVIEGASAQELADARITEEDRQLVRRLVAVLEPAMPSDLLMLVAGGVEAAAWRKRAAERDSA
jgi:hypothetical protein